MHKVALALALALVLVGASAVAGCPRDVDRYTSYDSDDAVQRERYRRLGLRWNAERAAADYRCIIRSPRLPEVIVAGGLIPERERAPDAVPCDHDLVFIGSKTLVVGIDSATDRIMMHGGWAHLEETERLALLEAWFRVGLTAGVDVIDAATREALEATGEAWTPVAVEVEGGDYRVSGWVRWPGDGRYELRRCVLTASLTFRGCEALRRVGFE